MYVNDASTDGDYFTTAPGDDANNGLTPATPKASVQSVLAEYDLGPLDLVVIDTGTYADGTVVIGADDQGAAYAGSPGGSRFDYGGTRFEVTGAGSNLFYGLRLTGSGGTGFFVHGAEGGDSSNNVFRANTFVGDLDAIRIDGGQLNVVRDNVITGTGTYGVWLPSGGTATISGNAISSRHAAVSAHGTADLTVENNTLTDSYYGLFVGSGTATVSGNEIADNTTGLLSYSSNVLAFGNDIHRNTVGIEGYGTFGGADWSAGQPNDVYDNDTGIAAWSDGTIRFNRIHRNQVGLRVGSRTNVHHNLIYRNTSRGILIDGASDVQIVNNTIYTPAGDGIRVQNFSSGVALRNNIVWTEDGYDLWVDTNSQTGFRSDYNNFYTSGAGKIAWWQKDFTDLFDWQVEADYDSHSIGYTALAPLLDNPQFVDRTGDDYRLTPAVSTSIDAGDPDDLRGNEPGPNGGRINLGAYGNTSLAAISRPAYIEIDYPNYYVDLQSNTGQTIVWNTFDDSEADQRLAGNIVLELWEEGVGKMADIATRPAADRSVGWTPAEDLGIGGDVAKRYRIKIVSLDKPAVHDTSRETFSIVPDGNSFYVDDDDNTGDQYTPTATGNNRNTGQTPGDPKANLLPILRSYDLGPGDTVHLDTGDYHHVRNVVISGELGLGDDEGATFTGPTDPARVARIDRGNPYSEATNIELNGGDYVTLRHLTLTGGHLGLWVHNGSTNFQGSDLVVANNSGDGIRIESDAEATQVQRLTAYDNAGHGVSIATPIGLLSGSTAYDNDGAGFHLVNTGDTRVEENAAWGNSVGMMVSNHLGSTTTVIGNPDLALGRGNLVYGNGTGISASGRVLIAGNTVRNSGGTGVELSSGATAAKNVVYGNVTGIETAYSNGGGVQIDNNRVYANSSTGIVARYDSQVRRNVVYSNAVGIDATRGGGYWWHPYTGSIANNVVYANAAAGLLVSGGGGARLLNNTVYQPVGDAVRIEGGSGNIQLRNNALWAEAGTVVSIANDSQRGLRSDYNNLLAGGTGHIGRWQNVPRTTLNDWRSATFLDVNSLSRDPLFVDRDGPDGRLGYDHATGVDYGADDDFHLQSSATDGAHRGSYHGGSLAPVLDAHSGLPREQLGTWTVDAVSSPLIDRGNAADAYANEPAPNGGYVNIGAYGNTWQASTSPAEYMLVTRPDGGEVWPAEQTFAVRWRSHDFGGGNALDFDGQNDYVTMGDPAGNELELGSQATLEAWVRFAAVPSYSLATIVSKNQGPGGQDKWIFGYAGNHGINRGTFLHITNAAQGSVFLGSDEWTPVVGQWYHLAVVKAGNDYVFYRDGVPDGTAAATFGIPDVAGAFEVGRAEGSFHWNGELDELRLWNTARSQVEIEDHRHGPLTGSETGLVGYWPFDQASGSTAADRTANQLDGMLGGGTDAHQPARIASRAPLSRVDLELLRGDTPVLTIAAGAPNDGEYRWTIPVDMSPDTNYRVRVTRSDAPSLTDVSDGPFEITEPIQFYYVNDGSVNPEGDWTTAMGDDGNDGLTPATPKASVRAILEAYELGPNSVIRVDDGAYTLDVTLLITGDDSGVTIEGYHDAAYPDRRALLDRNNASWPVVEFVGAEGVTLSHLTLTGGSDGVYVASGSGSHDLTVMHNTVFGNAQHGIRVEALNSQVRLLGNTVHNQPTGISVSGAGAVVLGNRVYSNSTGISVSGAGAVVLGNRVYSNSTGIFANADRAVVENNQVHDNATGIIAHGQVLAKGNRVYRQTGVGIEVGHGATALENEVFANATGIDTHSHSAGLVQGNRVYANTGTGIVTRHDSTVRGNVVYSNAVGIDATGGAWGNPHTGRVENNLVYANANQGILVSLGDGSQVVNNTVYQEVGEAVRIEGGSGNIALRNNILWVEAGYGISVADDSQNGFRSDYNNLYVTGSGQVGFWQGQGYATREEWFYALNVDRRSQSVDPLFVAPSGADARLAFSRNWVPGTRRIIDDGDAGFQRAGDWIELNVGYQGDAWQAASSEGDASATWSFTGLEADAWYEVAVTWATSGPNAWDAEYQVREGEAWVTRRVDQQAAPADFEDDGVRWQRLGWFQAVEGRLDVRLINASSNSPVVADAVRIQQIEGDFGADDDFRVQSGSLTMDAGDPADDWRSEPVSNGGRINQGHTGNTARATTSPAELVQVLSANGLEKLEQGQTFDIRWHTDGLAPAGYYRVLVLADAPLAYYRLGEAAGAVAADSGGSGLDGVLLDGVTLGAAGVLQGDSNTSAVFDGSGAVEVPDTPALRPSAITLEGWFRFANTANTQVLLSKPAGTWWDSYALSYGGGELRGNVGDAWGSQHALTASWTPATGRWYHLVYTFDELAGQHALYVDGQQIASAAATLDIAYDNRPLLIGRGSYNDTPVNGFSGAIDEVALYGRVLAANEIRGHYLAGFGQGFGTVDIQLLDGGVVVEPIAIGAPNDGQFPWTVPARLGDDFHIRVTANEGSNPSDVSDEPFLITNDGPFYYVNVAGDADLSDNEYTTAAGDNANSGKSPDQPMASLPALVAAYDLDPGDIVYVDTGAYALPRTVILSPLASGVRIQGPTEPGHAALLDRGYSAYPVVELTGADGVTLTHLSLSGGSHGVYAPAGADSAYLTITGCTIHGNVSDGIQIGSSNDGTQILGNTVRDNGASGIVLSGADGTVAGNKVSGHANGYGIWIGDARGTVTSNEAWDNSTGIGAYRYGGWSEADRIVVAENTVHDNAAGIIAHGQVLAKDNRVYRQTGVGIEIWDGATALENEVFANATGIDTHNWYTPGYSSAGLVQGNRVYANTGTGIVNRYDGTVRGNFVYSNSVGINAAWNGQYGPHTGAIINNLVYANTNQGILVSSGNGSRLVNNTVYQEVGEAVRVQGGSANVYLRNNILWVEAGYGLYVAGDSQTGFDSQYNLFHRGSDLNARVGYWGGITAELLQDWHAVSGQDQFTDDGDDTNDLSRQGYPRFVDINGADNVLGYSFTQSYDGGRDDNFYLAAGSPAIDRADSWAAPPFDITGWPRVDDPDTVNGGSMGYLEGVVADSVFGPAAVGTAQGWHGDDAAWTLNLPFAFPFYGTGYSQVQVSSNGLLHFAGPGDPASGANSTAALIANARIAPLWDDLHTLGAGDDIFVDASVADQVTIRWDATNKADGADVQFAVVLLADGRFRFDYGGRPADLSPTVGVSKGDGTTYVLSAYDGRSDLNSVDSVLWDTVLSQYAAEVLDFSSQHSENAWGAIQVLGPPDTFVYGAGSPTAWIASSLNGTLESITVAFATPVYASGATIRQTGGNGFVRQIDVLDMDGVLHTVWTGTDPSQPGEPVDFRVDWPQTAFLVRGLKVHTDTDHDQGAWEEIDSIQLHGSLTPVANYFETDLGENRYFAYSDVGVATGWRWDDGQAWLDFGFAFPFFGQSYTGAHVSSNGLVQFSANPWPGDSDNSAASLASRIAVAPLWDDLRTDGDGDDIFVDATTAGQITIRWDATNKADGSDVNFAVTLLDTGELRFDYGPGNRSLSPTVGISRGDRYNPRLSAYDGRANLTSVASVRWALEERGFADLGAYEFRGGDPIPPQVTGTVPVGVEADGIIVQPVTSLTLTFSKALNPIDAAAPANYELRRAVNGVFNDGDDVVFVLTPHYTFDPLTENSQTVLDFGLSGEALPLDLYRLTVLGREDAALHDLAGNRLDGDRNGTPGPDYVRTFTVTTVPVAGTRIDMTIVHEPSATDGKGEVTSLPASAGWVHEWQSFWVEIWVSTPDTTAWGVAQATVDLQYFTNYLTAQEIFYGPAFTADQTGAIDDSLGLVRRIGGRTALTDVGDDAFVLLARVRFASTGDDQVPVDEAGRNIGPYNMPMALADGQSQLVGGPSVLPVLGISPATELWAVMYDIDDSQGIDFGDFSFFAAAFGRTVGAPESAPPYVWWADFDKSGRVDFGDLAFFAPNFGKTRSAVQSAAQTLVFPTNFPTAWRTGSGAGEWQTLGAEGEASSGEAVRTLSAAGDPGFGKLGTPQRRSASLQAVFAPDAGRSTTLFQREQSELARALWIVDSLRKSPTGESTAGHSRHGLSDPGRGYSPPAEVQPEPAVTLYSRSGSPAARQAERTYRWPDCWEPLEDAISLLAEQPAGQSPDDARDPHDALFALFGREEIR